MARFVESPNLPQNSILSAICGNIPPETETAFKSLGIELIRLKESRLLGKNVASHADLQCIHIGKNRILLSDEQLLVKEKLEKNGFDVTLFEGLGEAYPLDCPVNVAVLGKKVICKPDIIHPLLKNYIADNGLSVVKTNQGYSRCSACIVDENSVITEDENIKNACIKNGIDVLLIRKGFVALKGFDYGFIGGASFKLNMNTLVFNGSIEKHPDYLLIKSYLNEKNIECIGVGNYPLTDIGGIIPLTEE
jgi:hypothetical protein